MEINKGSWHYKAYSWSYTWNDQYVPQQSNLCSYVQRLTFMAPAMAFVFSMLFLLAGAICIVANTFMLPFGYYLRHPMLRKYDDDVGSYNGFQIGKFQLFPWHVLLPTLLCFLGYENWHLIHKHGLFNPLLITEMLVVPLLVIVAVVMLYKSTKGSILREYVDAKTQGICPLITFKGEQ